MASGEGLSILEALENLNTLVDADTLSEIEVTEQAQLISHKEKEEDREVYWVRAGADDQTVEAIKETFRVVYDYLQSFYQKMKRGGDHERLVEGINTIMVLVGEAAKKADRLGTIFKERVSDFEEYRALQDFYRKKVIKESFKEFAKAPIPQGKPLTEEEKWEESLAELLGGKEVEEVAGVHILNDIEVIKRDHLYELFYLKNEAGHNFFTFDLARKLKLACDFGEYAEEYFGEDPLLQIKNWEDKGLHTLSQRILASSKKLIDKFYKEALRYRDVDAVISLHKALMALMLAANPRNLIRQFSPKGCHRYFADFQLFLRETIESRTFQKFLIYSPPESKAFFLTLFDLVHSLCFDLFTLGAGEEELKAAVRELIERSKGPRGKKLFEVLERGYQALEEALKKHPSGPIFKALDIVREEEERRFDPLMQGNLPSPEGFILVDGHDVLLLRMPCPISQEFIHKAFITNEFTTFLRAYEKYRERPCLVVNFQDRTSWREHARSEALEGVARLAEFSDLLTVVTLAKDTDFYNQAGPYHELGDAREFISHFRAHLGDESTGYFFPPAVKKALFPTFIDTLLEKVHGVFFEGKKELMLRERLDFIELSYHFIILKIIELVDPDLLSLTSKDGLDSGGTATVGLIALLSAFSGRQWKEEEFDALYTVLFGPTLMSRERVIHPERFDRLHHMIRLMEQKKDFPKQFAPLYKKEIGNASFRFHKL